MRSVAFALIAVVGATAGLITGGWPSVAPLLVSRAAAQGPLTAAIIAGGLSRAIDDFKSALAQAGDESRSLGNSLQANAQNVLADLNNALKDRMNQAITALDAQERRLAEDAEALTRQLRLATQAIVAQAGDETRRTIVEADILAYNTAYSLPCRDQKPRIVAAFPGQVIVAQSEPILTLRGNYLDQGRTILASIGNRPVEIVERLATSIRIRLPDEVAPATLDAPQTVSVRLQGLETRDRTLWFGLICRERETAAPEMIAALTLMPQITHEIRAILRTTHLVEREITENRPQFSRTGSDRCDDNFPVVEQYRTSIPGAIRTRANVSVVSANCGSGIQSVNPSGPNAVVVNGRVQGCGAERGPFNTWLGCRGRGWLQYNISLVVTTQERVVAGIQDYAVEPSVADRSWVFAFPTASRDPNFEYEVTVTRMQGRLELGRWTLSGANPNAGPFKSRIADGSLAVELVD
jgi:hypothetical protein